jgi:hypothetical protein
MSGIFESIQKAFQDVYEENGEKFPFDKELYFLAQSWEEWIRCEYGYEKIGKILEYAVPCEISEAHDDLEKTAKKFTKAEIFDVISRAAFLAGATWAREQQAPKDFKPPEGYYNSCPFCGKEY